MTSRNSSNADSSYSFQAEKFKHSLLKGIENPQIKSYLQNNILNSHDFPYSNLVAQNQNIRNLSKRIESILANEFATIQRQIANLKQKTDQLKRKNDQLQGLRSQGKNKNDPSIERKSNGERPHQNSFVEELNRVEHRIMGYKRSLQLIKKLQKTEDEIDVILESKKKELTAAHKRCSNLESISENRQLVHPNEAQLQLEVLELQKQYDRKSILLDPQRLELQIQVLQGQLEGHTSSNCEKLLGISAEQDEKQMLFREIETFNQKYLKRKSRNKDLKQTLRQEIAHNAELIDQFVKYKYDSSIGPKNFLLNSSKNSLKQAEFESLGMQEQELKQNLDEIIREISS